MPTQLVRFLLARIEEDEDAATRILRQHRHALLTPSDADGGFVVASNNARAAKEQCRAKRRMIGEAQQTLLRHARPHEAVIRAVALATLRSMLSPYAHHVGCRDEWIDP